NTSVHEPQVARGPVASMPIVGSFAGCCPRAASGQAAAPPTSVMNSRRLIVAPRGQNHAPHRLTAVRVLERDERGANCDQLFSAGECRLCVPRPSQNRKGSESGKCCPLCPQKRSLPILELLSPPAFCERRHRGLALIAANAAAAQAIAAARGPASRTRAGRRERRRTIVGRLARLLIIGREDQRAVHQSQPARSNISFKRLTVGPNEMLASFCSSGVIFRYAS